MRDIGGLPFPETPEEAREWQPLLRYRALHSCVLVVATTRVEGTWKCYVTPVPGCDHNTEMHLWQSEGCPVDDVLLATALFPQFGDIPYAR